MLAVGGLALLGTAAFVTYQGVSNNADVRVEQKNIQAIATAAESSRGVLGSYAGVTTIQAIADQIPPASMVDGMGLRSRWQAPVLIEPTDAAGNPAAGLLITYEAVPAKACAKFARAASEGMYDLEVDGASVFSRYLNGDPKGLDVPSAIARCADNEFSNMAFTYASGVSGLAAMVLPPVSLPVSGAPTAPPLVAPTPLPPPAPPPPAFAVGYGSGGSSGGIEASCSGRDRYYEETRWTIINSAGQVQSGGGRCVYANPYNPSDYSLSCTTPGGTYGELWKPASSYPRPSPPHDCYLVEEEYYGFCQGGPSGTSVEGYDFFECR